MITQTRSNILFYVLTAFCSCNLADEHKLRNYFRDEITIDTLELGSHFLLYPRFVSDTLVMQSSELDYSRLIYARSNGNDSISGYSLTYGKCQAESEVECLSNLDCGVVYSPLYPFDSLWFNQKSLVRENVIFLQCNDQYFLWIFLDRHRYFQVVSKGQRDVIDFYLTKSSELKEIEESPKN